MASGSPAKPRCQNLSKWWFSRSPARPIRMICHLPQTLGLDLTSLFTHSPCSKWRVMALSPTRPVSSARLHKSNRLSVTAYPWLLSVTSSVPALLENLRPTRCCGISERTHPASPINARAASASAERWPPFSITRWKMRARWCLKHLWTI